MKRRTMMAASLATAFAPHIVRAQAPTRVRFVQSDWGLIFAPAVAALELGYFKDAGIAAEFTVGLGGAEALAAVIGGNAEVNAGAASSALRARQQGTDATVFGASTTRYASNVVISADWAKKMGVTEGSPSPAKLAALKGIRIAVIGLGSGTHQLALYLAKRAGLDPARDMTIVSITNYSALMAALQQGRIDAFVSSSPTSDQAKQELGATLLFQMTLGPIPELDHFLFVSFIARESWLKQNHDTVTKVTKAIDRALVTLHDPKATLTLRDAYHTKYFPKLDKPMFDTVWETMRPAWPTTVTITQDDARKVVTFLNEFGGTNFSDTLVTDGFDYTAAS
jgi:NitT/TauT family transport system substrate-binding protein